MVRARLRLRVLCRLSWPTSGRLRGRRPGGGLAGGGLRGERRRGDLPRSARLRGGLAGGGLHGERRRGDLPHSARPGGGLAGGGLRGERGQVTVLLLGAMIALVLGVFVLGAIAKGIGARSDEQRAADLAALSAARAMHSAYPGLFEPPLLGDRPNAAHVERAAYLQRGRRAALQTARRNGAGGVAISFPDADSFAPVRVRVEVRDPVRVGERAEVKTSALAEAELAPPNDLVLGATGAGEYDGPLAMRQGKPMRPDVAVAFDRLAAAAREDGHALVVVSGFRSNAEQAVLFARHPDPRWVAPPGRSLHRLGTELDLGPESAYGWLAANAKRLHFIQRYSWEPWHYGFVLNPGTTSVGFGKRGSAIRTTRATASAGGRGAIAKAAGSSGDEVTTAAGRDARSRASASAGGGAAGSGSADGERARTMPAFVPARFAPLLSRAAQRWNVSAALLGAQLYAESNFNPFAVSPVGALGIAQFMPATARGMGLADPFDAEAAINAQAHLMRDLLRQFGSVPLALAAYNAGPKPVQECGCVPPYPETRGYVARILGLLGGAGEAVAGGGLEVRLVR